MFRPLVALDMADIDCSVTQ